MKLTNAPSSKPDKARNLDLTKPEKESVGLISGQMPRSTEEWRVAVALWALKQSFEYQVYFLGGMYIVDFIVTSAAPILPIEVIGEWWHRNEDEEEYRRMILESILGVEIKYVVEGDLQSKQEAIQTIRALL